MKKIEDFGQKIGGARKDAWREAGLSVRDLDSMNAREAEKYVTKANIWPKPDYQAMVDDGVPFGIAYYQKLVRDSIAAKPQCFYTDTEENIAARQRQYVETVEEIKDLVSGVRSVEDIQSVFGKFFMDNGYLTSNTNSYGPRYAITEKWNENPTVTRKIFRAMVVTEPSLMEDYLETQAKRKRFLEDKPKTPRTTSTKPRKKRFTPPQLEHIERDGIDYRHGKDVDGEDYLETFGFKGGEFGNWLNQNDRQESMNMAFDALKDLSRVLGISDSALSLHGELSIAFGSRGKANTAAHYEPLRKVINLTKMHGAGSLAHEWWHALDDYLGVLKNVPDAISERYVAYKPVQDLVEAMFRKEDYSTTEYRKNSRQMAKEFSKFGGYWDEIKEMAARAFSCYVMDKLDNRSDYLVGHAEQFFTCDKKPVFPVGEERQRINAAFDKLFEDLKATGVLSV